MPPLLNLLPLSLTHTCAHTHAHSYPRSLAHLPTHSLALARTLTPPAHPHAHSHAHRSWQKEGAPEVYTLSGEPESRAVSGRGGIRRARCAARARFSSLSSECRPTERSRRVEKPGRLTTDSGPGTLILHCSSLSSRLRGNRSREVEELAHGHRAWDGGNGDTGLGRPISWPCWGLREEGPWKPEDTRA